MQKRFLLILAMMLAVNACISQNVAQNTASAPQAAEAIPYQPPKLSDAGSWTMVVIPDVQAYVERPCNHGSVDIMHTWILDNLDDLRIQQVLYTGDLVYRNDQKDLTPNRHSLLGKEQYKAFSRLMERLDGRIPYILCTGNHDYGHYSAESRATWFNEFFPTDRNPQTRKHLVACAYNSFDVTSLRPPHTSSPHPRPTIASSSSSPCHLHRPTMIWPGLKGSLTSPASRSTSALC